jgi:hypothetical protein
MRSRGFLVNADVWDTILAGRDADTLRRKHPYPKPLTAFKEERAEGSL